MCSVYSIVVLVLVFFFFKQKTAYEMRISDWSSDVCSSDLKTTHACRTSFGRLIAARATRKNRVVDDEAEVDMTLRAVLRDVLGLNEDRKSTRLNSSH